LRKEAGPVSFDRPIGIKVLSSRIARKAGLPRETVLTVLRTFIEVVGDMVRSGAFVVLKNLFSMQLRRRKARRTYLPHKDALITTPARSYIYVKANVSIIKGVPPCQKKSTSPAK